MMTSNVAKIAPALVVMSLALTGCARNISGDHYSDRTMGESQVTYRGTVIEVRKVTVGPEELEDNAMGIAGGAVAGGLGGSLIGKGSGNVAATAIGAIGGAVAGAFIEKELKTQDALEYAVELDNGSLRTIVQGPTPAIAVGERVRVIETVPFAGKGKSRSRVVRDNSR
jgi:outer membrane lipoprotein SlyB